MVNRGEDLMMIFFFNDTATTEIYTLSLHDALPISRRLRSGRPGTSRMRWRPRLDSHTRASGRATGRGAASRHRAARGGAGSPAARRARARTTAALGAPHDHRAVRSTRAENDLPGRPGPVAGGTNPDIVSQGQRRRRLPLGGLPENRRQTRDDSRDSMQSGVSGRKIAFLAT